MLIEAREFQCAAPNLVAMRTKGRRHDAVRSALRPRPGRIPIGEVRGAEALDLLKAWGTGHPGGIGTIHAGTALVAVLSGRDSTRRLAELGRVEGLNRDGDYSRIYST